MDEAPQIGIEDGVIVKFFTKAFQNEFKSKATGKPVFENREMVEIMFPGDNKTVVNQIVKDYHRNRFPQSYKAFKEGTILAQQGYPIEKWDILDPATKATLKYLHVMTIEQLADMSDSNLGNLGMGAHEMREKAKKWVKSNHEDEATSKMQAQIDELKAELAKHSNKSENEEPKRRGRKPKDELPPHMQE